MKKVIVGIIYGLLISCSSQNVPQQIKNYEKGMVYVLPSNIVELLSERIEDSKSIYFVLDSNQDEYTIYLLNYTKSNNWVENTNRYVDIKGKLYPLIFGSDYTFANKENANEYLINYKSGVFIRSERIPLFDNVYYIIFKSKGEVVKKM